ncbi:MAG: DUF4886 domain-containing protein, partial [Muribaculaceae bacterium]|nr:DUF4886 domain-containing protein [Muribaculaceae bacterium]
MKKISIVILFLFSHLLSFSTNPNNKNTAHPDAEIKILCLGNSFTEDAMAYVPYIINNIAPDLKLTIGIAYIGGCSLQQHYANIYNETITDIDNNEYTPTTYTLEKNITGGKWTYLAKQDIYQILNNEEWDIITLQQNGANAFRDWENYFKPYLSIYDKLHQLTSYSFTNGWIITQSAYAHSNSIFLDYWEKAANNAVLTSQLKNCEIFPFGTAIQNLRETDLKNIGDGPYHNLLSDTGHLQEGIGCYAAALTMALKILTISGFNDDSIIDHDNTEISEHFLNDMEAPGLNFGTGVIGMTPENILLAKQAAKNAIRYPYT